MNLNDLYEMRDPRDAYERDVDNSTSGFGKDSQAYRVDGGANDENHALDQQPTWYIRLNGKLIKDKSGSPYAFQDKAAANKAALTMQAKLFNKDKEFVLTTNPNDKPQGMAEGSQRVDSLVTDALKIMQGATMNDAVAALKTVLGNREYNDRRGHYSFYVRQLMDMYGQQGVAEGKGPLGQGDLGLALRSLGGNWSGWHEENSHDPDIEVYEYDDGEGGYYASGSIEHNLNTGEIEVHYQDSESDVDVDGTFNSIGDAMKALRGGNNYPSWGGKKPNFDRLGQRKQHGPDDLRKTDRTGRKGTLAGGPSNELKRSIQWAKGKHGPQGVLPEGAEFGANYAEQLAQKVFDVRPKLASEDDVLNIGYKVATQDLMSQVRANYLFARDQDFPSDFVSAYYYLQKQGVAEGHTEVKDKQGKVVSWKDDSEWHPAEKNKQGQPKDPRGVVTHMSDVARRKTADQQGVAEGSSLDNYRQRVQSQGFTDSPEERNADRLERKRRHNAFLDRIADIGGGSSDEERAHQAQQRMARDEYKLDRMKRDDDDWGNTFDMMRDRLNRYQWSSQRNVDPEQLAAISNIKYEPRKKNEAVQAKTDDKLRAYYAQRKAEKQKQQQGATATSQPVESQPRPSSFQAKPMSMSLEDWKKEILAKYPNARFATERRPNGSTLAGELGGGHGQGGLGIYSPSTGEVRVGPTGAPSQPLRIHPKQQGVAEAEVDSNGYSMDHADSGEYDYEGDQAKDQLNTIVRAARRLNGMLDDNENMPEWVQMKITNAADYIDTAADYIESNQEPELEEGWKEKLGGAALAGAMALGAGSAQARVTPDGQGGFTGGLKPTTTQQATDVAPAKAEAPKGYSKEYLQKAANPDRFGRYMISVEKAQELLKQMNEGDKIGNMDADKFDAAMSRLKQLAGSGPMKTVYDPTKRVYRNVPTAVQPKK